VTAVDLLSQVEQVTGTVASGAERRRGGRGVLDFAIRVLIGLARAAVSIGIVIFMWWAFLEYFNVSAFSGKGPTDVWHYLFSGPQAQAHRSTMIAESKITLRDAALGLVAGTVIAIGAAIAFNLWRSVERTFMPIAMVLRSVPLIAMTPLIAIIFGRNLRTVTVIASVVTFFPTLVNVTLALRSTPQDSVDLLRAYGASPFTTLRKVQIPNALPALFASLRVAAPLALVGAMLAEWLATGEGMGSNIFRGGAVSDYASVWTRVVLVTLYSIVLYQVIGVIEGRVLARYAPNYGR
jgi:ABC-type nitrate/sulfonate/bicarbonate transport system permease component